MDWNKIAKDDKKEVIMILPKKCRINSESDETNTKDETGNKNGDIKSNSILDNCKLTKDMPPYRKMDVFSFVFFSGLFVCFNFIYFVTCLKY